VESLAAIERVKLQSTVREGEIGLSDGEHSLSHEQSITRDDLPVRTITIKTGAPAVSRSGSHEGLEATARADETVYAIKPKLPKITLPRFSGEITKFRAFWDSFESAVDKNPNLSAVDKFNYLNALLEGSAARSIQGLSLSEVNYTAAIEILKERFGRTQAIISAHMESLLQLPVCAGDRSSHLRLVYDKIKVNVRGLEALGVRADQYGSFLIPIIMAKLPSEVRLQIARVTNKDVWEVEELLQVIKAEVEAREISDTIKVQDVRNPDTSRRNVRPTASTLMMREQCLTGRECVYCKGEHYSASCEVITSVPARRDILKKEGRCYVCLARGHRATQCRSSKRCRKCNHRHHQSLCEIDNLAGGTESTSLQP